jgi:hypothetical protein
MLDIVCLSNISSYLYLYRTRVNLIRAFNVKDQLERAMIGIIEESMSKEMMKMAVAFDPILIVRYIHMNGTYPKNINRYGKLMVNYFNRDLRSIKLNELQMIIDMIERYGSPKILMRRFPQIRGWEDMSTRYPTKREMDYGLIQYLVSVGEGDMLTWIATITRMW